MATFHFTKTTTATPEQIVAAVTDFGPGRSKIFPNSADGDLVVHSRDGTHADVTEGSRGVWERLQYDWSDPSRIVMKTIDSNAWGGASGHTYTLSPSDGHTDVDVVVVREPKNAKGRLLETVLKTIGRGQLEKAFDRTLGAIEANAQGAGVGSGSLATG